MATDDRDTPAEGTRASHDGAPEGLPPAVHAYLAGAFGRLSSQINDAVTASRGAVEIGRELTGRMTVVEWHVFGSTPPPTVDELVKAGKIPAIVPVSAVREPAEVPTQLVGRVTDHELDIGAIESRELVRDAEIATIKQHIVAQSKAMGVVAPEVFPSGEQTAPATAREARAAFFSSRAGRRFILAVIGLVLGAATTILSAYTAHLASSSPPAPAYIMIDGRLVPVGK